MQEGELQALASITQACSSTPVHSPPLHASPAWHHLLELAFQCGGPSPLAPLSVALPVSGPSSQCRALTAQRCQGRVEWSAAECVRQPPLEGSRAPAHPSPSKWPPYSPRGCPSVKQYLEVCREHGDRLGKMWTGQGQHWTPVALWTLCSMCSHSFMRGDRQTEIWRGGIIAFKEKVIGGMTRTSKEKVSN